MIKDGIVYCDPHLQVDLYAFMVEHAGCNCVIEREYADVTKVMVIAYATDKKFNGDLVRAFYKDVTVEIVHSLDDLEGDILDDI